MKDLTIQKAAEVSKSIRVILINILFFAALIFVMWFVINEISTERLIIEPAQVPQKLENMGYSGNVVANRIIDELLRIKRIAQTQMEENNFRLNENDHITQLNVPGIEINVNSALNLLRNQFGKSVESVSSEIILLDDKVVEMTIRIRGQEEKSHFGPITRLDSLLSLAAMHIYNSEQPYILASFLYEQRDIAGCKRVLRNCINQKPRTDDKWAFNLLGLVLQDENKDEEAIVNFKKAIQIDSLFLAAYTNLGKFYLHLNDYQKATEILEVAIINFPNNAIPHRFYGTALMLSEKFEEAIDQYKRAIKLDDQYYPTYLTWGLALYNMGEYEEAITKYKKALEFNSDYDPAYNNWGDAYVALGRYGEAVDMYNKALDCNPNNTGAFQGRIKAENLLLSTQDQ